MEFVENELEFLNFYALCSNQKFFGNDKLQIMSIPDSANIAFVIIISNISLVTILKDKNLEKIEFSYVFSIGKISKLVSLSKNKKIVIDDKGVKLGKSVYKLDLFDFNVISPDELMRVIKLTLQSHDTIEVIDIDKISKIKHYLGEEGSGLDTIALFDNCFVVSNRAHGTGIVKTGNSIKEDIFFTPIIYNFLSFFKKVKDLNVKIIREAAKTKYFIQQNGINVFIEKNDNIILPNLLLPGYQKIYNHPYKIQIEKLELMDVIKRIMVVSDPNVNNKIKIIFETDCIRIRNIQGEEAEEFISTNTPKEIVSGEILLSAHHMLHMISVIDSDYIVIKVPDSSIMKTIKVVTFTGKDNSELLFIQNTIKQ